MKLDDKFRFGKHNGVHLSEVLETDVGYVDWAVLGEGFLELDNEAYEKFIKAKNREDFAYPSPYEFDW